LRISVISSSVHPANPDYYGSEVQSYFLAKSLAELGHEVLFYAPPKSLREGVRLRAIPPSYSLVSLECELKAYLWYRDELLDSDLIIDMSATCITCEQLYYWHREWLRSHLCLWTRNGTGFYEPRDPVNKRLHGVCLSETAKRIAVQRWGIPADRIHVIPYGTDLKLYRPSGKRNPRDYLLYLSRPHKDKGLLEVLKLAELLPEERFVLAWRVAAKDHEYWDGMAREVARSKELKNVKFVNLLSAQQKVELYQRAKALLIPLHPSYVEAFGLVFIESLACGTPVITAAHGATSEVVENGVTGFLCKKLEEYRKAIENVCKISRKECRKVAERKFSGQGFAQRYLTLYESLRSSG